MKESVLKEFTEGWYYSDPHKTWGDVSWLGHKLLKNPMDLWIYQEIVYKVKPDVIVETGTGWGGSALYLANICDLQSGGRIHTIDNVEYPRPIHPRITYHTGSSVDESVVKEITDFIWKGEVVLIILDSDHHKDHVLQELRLWSRFVTPNSYLIVEDTHLNHTVEWKDKEGPMAAVEEFLRENPFFRPDSYWEKFYFTFSPRGFLKRC